MVKNPPANAGDIRDVGSIPGLARSPGEGNGNPPQYSCLENPYGQRSLTSYSSWGHKRGGHDQVTQHKHKRHQRHTPQLVLTGQTHMTETPMPQ